MKFIISFYLGTILFAVTGGPQISNKKVYMIDAQSGDILTSFDSKPVSYIK
jgi:D-alanyl-D-alanine carboxypeptidase